LGLPHAAMCALQRKQEAIAWRRPLPRDYLRHARSPLRGRSLQARRLACSRSCSVAVRPRH